MPFTPIDPKLLPEGFKAPQPQGGAPMPSSSGSPSQTGGFKPLTSSATVPEAPKKSGIFSKLQKAKPFFEIALGPLGKAALNPMDTAQTAADMVKNTFKGVNQLTVQNPAIAEIAGVIGGEDKRDAILKPRNYPGFGEVKPLSAVPEDVENNGALSPAQGLAEAGNIFLEGGAPGAGKVISKVASKVKGALPNMSKTAEVLSNVPGRIFDEAAAPEMAQKIKDVRMLGMDSSPESVRSLGEEVFTQANKLKKKAMEDYSLTRDAIIGANKGKIIQRSQEFVKGVEDVLTANKIKLNDEGVDLVGSQFEGSTTVAPFLDRARSIMTRPLVKGAEAVDDLLTRREALTGILDDIPYDQKNLRRVVGKMKESFDTTLDDVLGPEATKLRADYAKTIQPSNELIDELLDPETRVLSSNKAARFIKQATLESGFDQRALLAKIDELTGSSFSKTARAIGIDQAISQLAPPTGSRIFDVVRAWVATLPVLKTVVPLFSPKLWGEVALTQGMKAAKANKFAVKQANDFRKLFLTNLLTLPVREGLDAATAE